MFEATRVPFGDHHLESEYQIMVEAKAQVEIGAGVGLEP